MAERFFVLRRVLKWSWCILGSYPITWDNRTNPLKMKRREITVVEKYGVAQWTISYNSTQPDKEERKMTKTQQKKRGRAQEENQEEEHGSKRAWPSSTSPACRNASHDTTEAHLYWRCPVRSNTWNCTAHSSNWTPWANGRTWGRTSSHPIKSATSSSSAVKWH